MCSCAWTLVLSPYTQAYKQNLRYPVHQFLVYGWYSDGWWVEGDPARELGCTLEDRTRTLEHALAPVQSEFYSNYSLPTEGGLVRNMTAYIWCPRNFT